MSVIEQAVIEHLNFEVWDTALGAWRDLANKATTVTIQRGGSRDSGVNKIGVGTLETTLYGDVDLTQETALKPNAPIRVVQPLERLIPLWQSGPNASDDSVFTPVVPAVLAAYGVASYTNSTTRGVQVALKAGTPPTAVPAGAANRFAERILGDETGMRPGRTYRLDTTARMQGTFTNYPVGATFRLVAYAYDADAGVVQGAALGSTPAKAWSKTYATLGPLSIVAPAAGLSVLLAAELVGNPTVVNATTTFVQAFATDFTAVNITRYFDSTPRFTGTLADLAQTVDFDKGSGIKRVFTSLYAVDAVQPLANTQRYGAVSDTGAGFEAWNERIRRLTASAPANADYDNPPSSFRTIFTWGKTALYPFAGTTLTAANYTSSVSVTNTNAGVPSVQLKAVRTAGTAAQSFAPSIRNTRKMLPDAGRYRVEFDVTLGLIGFKLGQMAVRYGTTTVPVTLPNNATTHVTVDFENTKPATGPDLVSLTNTTLESVAGSAEFVLQMANYTITAIGDPKGYNLADVAYESDLASHFDLACNSVGARWWVDLDNIVQFSRDLFVPAPLMTFTDDDAAGTLGYVDLGLAFDTRNVVNALTLNQHGRDAVTGNAADTSATFTSPSSIDRWGSRAGAVDTCLYAGPGYESIPRTRALEVIGDVGRPAYAITSLRWNAQEDPTKVPLIDVYTPVEVRYESTHEVARVVGIKETITPTRWLIDLDLTDIRAGYTFQQISDAWAGLTFAQINARLAGKTFRQINANPTA